MTIWTDLTHTTETKIAMLARMMPAAGKKNVYSSSILVLQKPKVLHFLLLHFNITKSKLMFNSPKQVMLNTAGTDIRRCCVFCDYIFLDTDERRRFAQVSHEYLIEQLQYSNPLKQLDKNGGQVELRFNHPVKEIFWHTDTTSASVADLDGCLFNLMVMIVSEKEMVHTSEMFKDTNIIQDLLVLITYICIHLHLNLKNINLPELAISQELITQFFQFNQRLI